MEMDKRIALLPDEILDFPGLTCHIISEIGRGSNALVYRAWYADHHHADEHHEVLIKELFPVHPNGGIYRAADRSIVCTPEGEETYTLHRESFEVGNSVHLALLKKQPDGVGANLNTYASNGTLYTVLGFNGGRSLSEEFTGPTISLRPLVERMIKLLNELEGFHENGLLHLDIAPDNIMLLGKGNRERMMLIDFNSCQYIEAAVDSASVFSAKPGYTAPEILIRRYDRIGPWTDLYSVAAILYRAITGQELTTSQMLRRQPPDVGDCPCMIDMPDSVHSLMQAILRKGLHELARKRYASVREMREDLSELLDRIDGVGITHSALWEAGRRNVMRTVRGNPSMTFIRDDDRLYPSNAKVDGETAPVGEQLNQLMAKRENALLIAGGGMGKTTAMLRSALECTKSYSGNRPAVAYLSLYGWQPGERNYILNRVLETLRFKPETRSFEDARKALLELLERPLSTPQGQRPVLLLMLDGLNETISERQPLIEEIMQLSGMQGVGIVVATRTDESALPFRKLELAALEESDVNAVLAEAGLLLPESPEMRLLLRTPLMLSIYVQSLLAEQKQLNVRTQGDLMSAYFAALKEKELSSAPENAEGRWQIEAALDYVLPSLASELHRRNRALEDARLLPVVENCWKLFHSRLMRRAFPQWIGHSAAIRGEAKSAEEWYGRIVHELLWKRLGMLLRDEQGRYQIAHQIIEEYLLNKDRDNRKQIERRRWVKTALILTTITIVLLGGYFIYDSCFRPKPLVPYSEKLADNVMERAASAYVAAGNQYERLKKLTEYAARSPDRFEEAWERYEGGTSVAALPMDYSEKLLKDLLASGEVMPWSGKPMDTENALALLRLYGERKEVYEEYAALLRFVLTDEQAERHYASEYPARLLELLEVDADINATLYQIVCEPHVTGKYADGSTTEKNYDSLMEDVTEQNKHLSDTTDIDVLKRNMDILYGLREKCKGEIDASGAKAMYLRKGGST